MEIKKNPGQHFFVGFRGVRPPKEIFRLIEDYGVCGILFFAENCEDLRDVAALIQELKRRASGPLCVAVDHEGGRVHRLPKPATHFPPMCHVGRWMEKMPSADFAADVGRAMGRELKAIGFDTGFSPVVDVCVNPLNKVIGDRSFSLNAERVSQCATQFITALQAEGVAACAKHFPGHGDTVQDSHETLPVLNHNRIRLDYLELAPFRAAIRAGAASVMTAHVVYSGIDRDLPATLSVKLVRDLLRGELRFDGLIFSDSLDMKAIANRWSMSEAAILAFNAGCDVMILGRDPLESIEVIDHFAAAVARGDISESQLVASEQRIAVYQRLFVTKNFTPNLDLVGCKEHRKLAARLWV